MALSVRTRCRDRPAEGYRPALSAGRESVHPRICRSVQDSHRSSFGRSRNHISRVPVEAEGDDREMKRLAAGIFLICFPVIALARQTSGEIQTLKVQGNVYLL